MMSRNVVIASVFLFSYCAEAAPSSAHRDLHNVEGENGIVHFHGAVLVSPCLLDSGSQEQDIDMGDVPARLFKQAGDRSARVIFAVKMKDCLAGARSSHRDVAGEMTGSNPRRYTSQERVISLTFSGESDAENPDLLKVNGGVRGLGLRLLDGKGQDLVLNQSQSPYLLMPGDNSLTFMATLESTRNNVGAGHYYSVVRLRMEYL